jgi:diphthine synthase
VGEILFVGVGLHDERDLSLRAVDELKSVDAVFAEQYTSRLSPGSLKRLEELIGKTVIELSREELEGEKPILEALSRNERVALLVAGEPFAATTHIALRLSVENNGHKWRILHNSSILTAAASLVGLSHYKFGRTVSLPHPKTIGYRPSSPYDALMANWKGGLHSLVLLDLDPVHNRYLTAELALRHLGTLETEFKGGVAGPDSLFCVVSRAGSPDAAAWFGTRLELEELDFGPPLHSIIVPGPSLHFLEKEALEKWRPHRK